MQHHLEAAINRWHDAVNAHDSAQTIGAVTDPVVVLGPKGAGPISPDEFADWVVRSGISLTARSWHPVSERLMVVEQDAAWPGNEGPTRVATVFRVTGDQVSASLRLPDLRAALDLAFVCGELAATE
ncbi:hypothetical protein [Kribbella endophytica]